MQISNYELPDRFPCAENAGREVLYKWMDPVDPGKYLEQRKIAEVIAKIANHNINQDYYHDISPEILLIDLQLKSRIIEILEKAEVDPNFLRVLKEDEKAIQRNHGRITTELDNDHKSLKAFEIIRRCNERLGFAVCFDDYLLTAREAYEEMPSSRFEKEALQQFLVSALYNAFYRLSLEIDSGNKLFDAMVKLREFTSKFSFHYVLKLGKKIENKFELPFWPDIS